MHMILARGCMSWTRSLIDTQKFSSGGVDLYIRVAYSELGELFCTAGPVVRYCGVNTFFMIYRYREKCNKNSQNYRDHRNSFYFNLHIHIVEVDG